MRAIFGYVPQFCQRYLSSQVRQIDRTGLFDRAWYIRTYEDVARSGLDPIAHYVFVGVHEGRNPNPVFQTRFYLSAYLDVAQAEVNPLLHYCEHGIFEARDPNPFFDTEWYLRQNPQVGARRENPLMHYLSVGATQGLDPSPFFDTDWYLERYPDVAAGGHNALAHYLTVGAAAGRYPSPMFEGKSGRQAPSPEARSETNACAEDGLHPEKLPIDSDGLRAAIGSTIKTASGTIASPFYRVLEQVAEQCNPLMLQGIGRTLDLIDVPRRGAAVPLGPLVSVVMPVYNRRDLVRDAIESALAQSYRNFELLICDDGSLDGTADVVSGYSDPRIKLIRQSENAGAAAARNRCLEMASGAYIFYLDSDNIWHPHYLAVMIEALQAAPGQPMAYASYFDVVLHDGRYALRGTRYRDFNFQMQADSPYIDLNSVGHHRALYRLFGGFDERMRRLQDCDLIARYAWCRDPQFVPHALNIYRRLPGIAQITSEHDREVESRKLIDDKIARYHRSGVDAKIPCWVKKVTVLSWDMSRNHFAKAYSVAEALSKVAEVELISFRFFEDQIFTPLANRPAPFEIKCFSGKTFPDYFAEFSKALAAITGDVIYAVKPRLPSYGLALMANHERGIPVLLEANDLETVIASPMAGDLHKTLEPAEFLARADEALSPHAAIWSQLLDPMAAELPLLFTHNRNLNEHYRSRCLFMRNIKDETIYDPARYDRNAIRQALGLKQDDRMILFGGLVRKHKGIVELARWVELLRDPHLKLFVASSQDTPELHQLAAVNSAAVTVLPPQPPEKMAELNLAADAVVLWLDPDVPASHYQMPYKFTDAIAMGTPVIAAPVSDLAGLGHIVWHVPFGDFDALRQTLQRIFAEKDGRQQRCDAGRRLFEKEFSYRSARENFALACAMIEDRHAVYPVSETFAAMFRKFSDRFNGNIKQTTASTTR